MMTTMKKVNRFHPEWFFGDGTKMNSRLEVAGSSRNCRNQAIALQNAGQAASSAKNFALRHFAHRVF
jgi:hypothetical protein